MPLDQPSRDGGTGAVELRGSVAGFPEQHDTPICIAIEQPSERRSGEASAVAKGDPAGHVNRLVGLGTDEEDDGEEEARSEDRSGLSSDGPSRPPQL